METTFSESWEEIGMRQLKKLWFNQLGQDMIEYALTAAFLAVAVGALSPTVATNICTMFSRVNTVLTAANNGASPSSDH
jgi:Flp pilus assembly pilin Flp